MIKSAYKSIAKATSAILFALLLVLGACGRQRPPEMPVGSDLPDIYPDYLGVTIPAEIAPMNFNIDGEDTLKCVYVRVTGSKGGEIEASGRLADFDEKAWHKLTEVNRGGTLTFDVYTCANDGTWTRFKPFEMHVSEHPLTDYGVTYRKIAPGFETFSKIGIYERALGSFDEHPILEETAINGQCLNCHYANRANPAQYSIHVRGANGGTIIRTPDGVKYLNTKTPQTAGSCTYGYWHPDGRYCAYSLNKIYQNFYVGPDKIIEIWDDMSDIAVLDTQTGALILSPLVSTIDCETTPAFSADGRTLYFCHAPKANMPAEYKDLRYDLFAIGFDAGKGEFGAQVDTIIVVSALGKSLSLPRPSYDGRYLMYCLTDYGTSPIYRQESDLYLLDLSTGQSREMTEINSDETDAYHNWSSDSRWFLFGSKREDHLYSQIFLSCIGDDGIATKPFLLPQRNPKKYYHETLYSFNAPDFTSAKVDLDPVATHRMVMDEGTTQVKVKK